LITTVVVTWIRQLFLLLVALVLAACAEPSWVPDEVVERSLHATGEPASITLYTVVNNRSGSGAHSALLVNGSHRALFDPAGTFRHPEVPERNDVHFGVTEPVRRVYIDYHARASYDVIEQKILVSPAVAERALAEIQAYGAVPKAQCSVSVTRILQRLPGFESIDVTWFPNQTSEAFGQLAGVATRRITDDDADDNHGVLLIPQGG